MRTLTLCLKLDCEAFDQLTGDALEPSLNDAVMRAYPLLRESEFDLQIMTDQYAPPAEPKKTRGRK